MTGPFRIKCRLLSAAGLLALCAGPALAQGSTATANAAGPREVTVCGSQQALQQWIQDQGKVMPDGCRVIRITSVASPQGPLCLVDTSHRNPGVLGSIENATTDTSWWTSCKNLSVP